MDALPAERHRSKVERDLYVELLALDCLLDAPPFRKLELNLRHQRRSIGIGEGDRDRLWAPTLRLSLFHLESDYDSELRLRPRNDRRIDSRNTPSVDIELTSERRGGVG